MKTEAQELIHDVVEVYRSIGNEAASRLFVARCNKLNLKKWETVVLKDKILNALKT